MLAWKVLRRRRWATVLIAMSWLLAGPVLMKFVPSGDELFIMIPTAFLFWLANHFLFQFHCPRCDGRFGTRGGYWSPGVYLRRRCAHCGIAVGTRKESERNNVLADA
jgi:hypothetical protein